MSWSENRSRWESVDDHRPNRGSWFDERTRWRVGNLAESMHRAQHGQGERLADEAEAFLRGVAEGKPRRMRRGEPGE